MFKESYKAIISIGLLTTYLTCLAPQAYSQNGAPTLGQSDWQTLNTSPNQQIQSQQLGQSPWQTPGSNMPYNQAPGLNNTVQPSGTSSNAGQSPWQNQPTGQSPWQAPAANSGMGVSGWQQPQNTIQANVPNSGQQNPDYYGQGNQNQPNPYAFSNGQYGQYQGQVNYSAPGNNANNNPNNQWSSNLPPASSIPPNQNQQQQKPQSGGLKRTLGDVAKAATQAAGLGMGAAAPLAGVYMMSRAMKNTVPTYGYSMPYGGYGYSPGYGYPGMAMPMTYATPNYGMMNMAPMYTSAFSGLSSFMMH